MTKISNDKYYTPEGIVVKCLGLLREAVPLFHFSEIVEPSAGNGAFVDRLKSTFPDTEVVAYDIEPDRNDIIKADFLALPVEYKEGRLIIGNPPFGTRNTKSVKFFQKSCELCDYIAFIQPISQLNNNMQMYQFDLIASYDLGVQFYTDRYLHCCFNIYKRPKQWFLNPKPNYKLKDITIIEHRRKKGCKMAEGTAIPPNFDYAICNWGNGSLGKVPEFVGEYAQEVYFYCHKKELLPKLLELLKYSTIRDYVKSISMKKISVARLYKYLKDNIVGVE